MTEKAPKLRPGTLGIDKRHEPPRARTFAPPDHTQPVSRWHSLRWWAHHHLHRAECGEWAPDGSTVCRHRAAALAAGGREFVHPTQWAWRDDSLPAPAYRVRKSYRQRLRETARDDLEAARHAQELREEAYSKGNETERRSFYGSGHAAQYEGAEKRVRGYAAAAERHDREQRALDAERRRRKK